MGEILQEVNISLLGGSTARVTAPYILNRPPKGPGRPRGKGSRGTAGNGLYPALEALGLNLRVTPALAEEVCRLTTLEPPWKKSFLFLLIGEL